jgi:hypothetical protein
MNGWANWATWNVTLWARNDEANYNEWVRMAQYYEYEDLDSVADALREELPRVIHAPDMEDEDWDDVDWHEVADALMKEL